MKKLFTLLSVCLLISILGSTQTVGSTKTEQYKASFETKLDISQYLNYDGPTIPIQILKCGIGDDKTEIKNRMVKQFQASAAGISQDKLDGRGKIRLAHYFVEIEVYDWSVSDDEEVNLKDGVKNTMVTRLGLQVRFTDAETGEIIAASGLGEAKTTRELTFLSDATVDPVKFNQSTVSIATKKALDIACARILARMIKKDVFKK